MSCYVDNAMLPLGRMKMCHMVADSTDELLEMAQRIGVDRKHIQDAGTYREHFDVCLRMRARAVWFGAKEVSACEIVELQAKRKPQSARTAGDTTERSGWK